MVDLRSRLPWHTRVAVAVITTPVRVVAGVFQWVDERERRRSSRGERDCMCPQIDV